MYEGTFERKIKQEYEEVNGYYPETITEAIHPLFPNGVGSKWIYPPKPTVQAMSLFGKLKIELCKLNIRFEMGLEIGFFTETENRFIDIAVWYNSQKHAIEVHGNTKDEERINQKTQLLKDHNWIVYNVYNYEIEEEEMFPRLINHLVKEITNPTIKIKDNLSQAKIIPFNKNDGITH